MSDLTRARAHAQEAPLRDELKSNVRTATVLALFALVAIAMATFAWFSISDQARARSLAIEAHAGGSLRFDLDAHGSFDEYVSTLGFDAIASRLESDWGYSMDASKLEPVTTSDGQTFTFEDGSAASAQNGSYLEFTLNFMSTEDETVRLTGEAGRDGSAGTSITSSVEGLPQAMRMSFTVDGATWIYNPNASSSGLYGSASEFGLSSAAATDSSNMLDLRANTNRPVIVRIWLEGNDPNCTNMVKGADYSISMRFEGVPNESEQ